MRAAWKSIECGISPPLTSVNSTAWPCRTWMIGPGAEYFPSKAQTLYFTPGATSTVLCFMTMRTLTTSVAAIGGIAAS
jgi:hypothetical protein